MKEDGDVLIIKLNLLPWYNELDDQLEVGQPDFPAAQQERIISFGEYTISFISHKETHLKKVKKD
ncbi:hypothetical protein [Paenibacillus sedimenti]|uniref:Uncharacterized protein n=1 Tax=Paenibacillus sedimenti TaxID=2770274 RepID=A0A926KTR6_9BACL|nr:hypothetical protein [Paenibacillus sedimenti]MBD0382996.1 hypothetical protein [Paenibacillus sedimenti]